MVEIAGERIELLYREADKAALGGQMDLADRYVELARNVGMRYNVRVPQGLRRKSCRECYRYLLPGTTSRTRLKRGRLVITCLRCGHITRIPIADRHGGPEAAGKDDGGGDEKEEG
jgi:ribonuclease P protein subunit RPR2